METLADSRFDILGVQISDTNLPSAGRHIEEAINRRRKIYICVSNVATIVDCQKDKDYRDVVNGADLVTPDGMPLVWIGGKKGSKTIARTYGPDLMQYVIGRGQTSGLRHYFFGGTDVNLGLLKDNLKKLYPEIQIAGSFAPPMRKIREEEPVEIISKINDAKPDVLWVGLGSPKQDFWMNRHRDSLNVPVIIGVGAAFDFLAGIKKQAPKWMQKCGLEWFFRLCTEPRRLWKRYIIGNTQFFYYLLVNKLKGHR